MDWNDAAATTFGHQSGDAIGRSLGDLIIPARFRGAHREALQRAADGYAHRLPERLHLTAIHRDGTEFPIVLTITSTDGPDGRTFHAFAEDVTTSLSVMRLIAVDAAVSRALAAASSSRDATRRVVEAIAATMGFSVADVWLIDQASGTRRCAARYVTADQVHEQSADAADGWGATFAETVIGEGRSVWWPDPSHDRSPGSDLAETLCIAAGTPIRAGETILGALCVYTGDATGAADTILALLGSLATQLGQFLQRRQAEKIIARRVSRFTAVESAVSRGLAEAESCTTAADRVTKALGSVMGWPVAELWLADEQRSLVTCAARHTTTDRALGPFGVDTLEPGTALPGRAYQQGCASWIPDLAADTTSPRSHAGHRIGLHVAAGVPITSNAHVLGALCFYADRVEDPEDTLIALLTGIAAQVGQYLERRRAEELALELARHKDEFLALVTHEIRNPLSVITAAADLLSTELDILTPDELRQHLTTITNSAARLALIADDLLDLARLESGAIALDPAPTDLRAIIDDAIQDLRAPATAKSLTLTLELPEPVPLHADAHRLRQVADNLLSNAIKYTPAGGTITIKATTTAGSTHPTSDPWITWTVTDTGIGIPPAERPHLFRRFYRASTAIEHRIPGTGLGLVITRTIIERHHGTITLAEHVEPGTSFHIRLPTKPPA